MPDVGILLLVVGDGVRLQAGEHVRLKFREVLEQRPFGLVVEVHGGHGGETVMGEIETRLEAIAIRPVRLVDLLEIVERGLREIVLADRQEILDDDREIGRVDPRLQIEIFNLNVGPVQALAEKMIQPFDHYAAVLAAAEQRLFGEEAPIGRQTEAGKVERLHDDPEQRENLLAVARDDLVRRDVHVVQP